MYGNPHTGYKFYPTHLDVDIVRGSDEQYFERRFLSGYFQHLLHAFLSIEGRTEAFNDHFRDTEKEEYFKAFLAKNPSVGGHFKSKEEKAGTHSIEDQDEDDEDHDAEDHNREEQRGSMHELQRKALRTAFYSHEVRLELEERQIVNEWTFGPKECEKNDFKKVSFPDSVSVFMEKVDEWRRGEIYAHEDQDCSKDCRDRGCQQAVVVDGCWKLQYKVSLYSVNPLTPCPPVKFDCALKD